MKGFASSSHSPSSDSSSASSAAACASRGAPEADWSSTTRTLRILRGAGTMVYLSGSEFVCQFVDGRKRSLSHWFATTTLPPTNLLHNMTITAFSGKDREVDVEREDLLALARLLVMMRPSVFGIKSPCTCTCARRGSFKSYSFERAMTLQTKVSNYAQLSSKQKRRKGEFNLFRTISSLPTGFLRS